MLVLLIILLYLCCPLQGRQKRIIWNGRKHDCINNRMEFKCRFHLFPSGVDGHGLEDVYLPCYNNKQTRFEVRLNKGLPSHCINGRVIVLEISDTAYLP